MEPWRVLRVELYERFDIVRARENFADIKRRIALLKKQIDDKKAATLVLHKACLSLKLDPIRLGNIVNIPEPEMPERELGRGAYIRHHPNHPERFRYDCLIAKEKFMIVMKNHLDAIISQLEDERATVAPGVAPGDVSGDDLGLDLFD